MKKTRIGIISFSDGRERVHNGLLGGILGHQQKIAAAVTELGADAIVADEVAFKPRIAVKEAKRLLSQDISAVILNIPVFAFPNLSVIAADVLNKPIAMLTPADSALPGMGGLLAAGGALEQSGHTAFKIWGSLNDPSIRRELGAFIRAAGAKHGLRGQVYGQIGGRSIGMMTGTAFSSGDWHKVFGVDMDHCDQSEILRRAALIPDAEQERMAAWLEKNLGAVQYQQTGKLTKASLKFQVACAAAVKSIIADRQYDFVGVKCHYDMSEYACTQCLSATFLPFNLDWDGPREPVACACEADGEGALTMQILQLLSGLPSLFMDLRHYDAEARLWTFCNCGGMSPYYSKRADNAEANLRATELVPVIEKYAGVGSHSRYIGDPGALTCARLQHGPEGMEIIAFIADAVEAKPEWTHLSCSAWPHIYARFAGDSRKLLEKLNANHIHAVDGDWVQEIEMFAKLAGIRFVKPD